MLKQILLKLILIPLSLVVISASIYGVFLFAGGYNVIQEPTGSYTEMEPITSDNLDPTTKPPETTTPEQSTPQPTTPKPTRPKTQPQSPQPPSKPAAKPATVPKQNASLYKRDSNLYRELGRIAKFNTPSLQLKYTSDPGQTCRSGVAVGCYMPSQSLIWISADFKANQSYRRDILAHEYMHYIWHQLGIGTASLQSGLKAKYTNSRELRAAIDPSYVTNGQVDPNEILAYSCTTLTKKQMGQTIYQVCNKYLHLSLLSPFINTSSSELIGAINYLRQKKNLAGVSTSASLNKAAKFGLDSVAKGNNLNSLQDDPNVTVNIRSACYGKQYHVNYLQNTASDQLYIAQNITKSNASFFFSNNISAIGVSIKKIPYSHPKSSSKPLVNSNLVIVVSC